jgi:prolyl-tRNA editing enzyme YbaK/EbsC (Cys-tRNA(Pro) deacylase)
MRSPADLERQLKDEGIEAGIVRLDTPVRTVAQAAAAMGVASDQIIKSLVFNAAGQPVLVIALGLGRVETSSLGQSLGLEPTLIELASPDEVLAATGYAVGTVPPLGLATKLDTLIDARIMQQQVVYGGGGSHQALLRLSPQQLLQHSRGRLIQLGARVK